MRRLLVGLAVAAGLIAGGIAAIHLVVGRAAAGRIYDGGEGPAHSGGIVVGAGRGAQLLRDRVATAAELYGAHKIKHLLLTGDNRRRSYDEPRAMRRLALELGVPASALVLDYAGRRTYDSCERARTIFDLQDAILVTQRFH